MLGGIRTCLRLPGFRGHSKLVTRFSWWQIWQLWLTVTVAFLETESEFAVWHSVQQFTLPRSALASTLWLVIV